MANLQILFTPEEIDAVVTKLARSIEKDYAGKKPLLLGALKGCFVFMADLVRKLDIPVELDFVKLSSYGPGRSQSKGRVSIVHGLQCSVKAKDVIIIEDIIDTGLTLDFLLEYLQAKKPSSIRVCTLLDKVACRKVQVPIDYTGFVVPDSFLVGYGLDYDERYRHLPGVYALEGELSSLDD